MVVAGDGQMIDPMRDASAREAVVSAFARLALHGIDLIEHEVSRHRALRGFAPLAFEVEGDAMRILLQDRSPSSSGEGRYLASSFVAVELRRRGDAFVCVAKREAGGKVGPLDAGSFMRAMRHGTPVRKGGLSVQASPMHEGMPLADDVFEGRLSELRAMTVPGFVECVSGRGPRHAVTEFAFAAYVLWKTDAFMARARTFLGEARGGLLDKVIPSPFGVGTAEVVALVSCALAREPLRQCQALEALPAVGALYRHPDLSRGKAHPLLDRIADGRPVWDVLRIMAGGLVPDVGLLRPAALRSLGTYRPIWTRAVGGKVSGLDRTFARAVSAYHDFHPKSPSMGAEETREIRTFLSCLGNFELFDADPILPARMVAALRGKGGRIEAAESNEARYDMVDALRGIETAVRALLGACGDGRVSPALVARVLAHVAFPDRRTAAGMRAVCAEWHASAPDAESERESIREAVHERERLAKGDGPVPFPHLVASAREVDGISVRPLLSARELAEEGRDLDHCVGSYPALCRRAVVVVFGLASKDGERSTASFVVGSEGLEQEQHRGPSNGSPPASHVAALASFMRSFALGAPEVSNLLEAARHAPSMADDFPDPRKLLPAERERWLRVNFASVSVGLDARERAMPPGEWAAHVRRLHRPERSLAESMRRVRKATGDRLNRILAPA